MAANGVYWRCGGAKELLLADIVDKTTRSRMMSGIRSQNTRPEMKVRSAMHRAGFRFRLHDRLLPGKPDLVFPKYRAVLFVHGCFWHRHTECHIASSPSTNGEFWQAKFAANVERDLRAEEALSRAGWRVALVWECATRKQPAEEIAAQVGDWLAGNEPCLEIPWQDGPVAKQHRKFRMPPH